MNDSVLLTIEGEVGSPRTFTFAQLTEIDDAHQIRDVSKLSSARKGGAVKLTALLDLVNARSAADYIGLHASADDFHASIPLAEVKEKAVVIYELDGAPLELKAGGPLRFFIPDHAACQAEEVDECANVKFVDRIELTVGKGYDNRPQDEDEHEELHRRQDG